MMRDIKFRAWNKCGFMCDPISFFEIQYYGEWKKDDLTIMQFTGLQDKNGMDIYEGDVIFRSAILFKKEAPIEETYVVYYRQDGFYALKPNNTDPNPAFGKLRHYTDFEVIGNIYENPELIEGE